MKFVRSTIGWCLVVLLTPALAGAAGAPLLASAAKNQDTQAVRALLQRGTDVNTPLPDGTTALHWSAQWANLDMAKLLVQAGANVNVVNDHRTTPLALSCLNGDGAMIAFLLNAGANPNIVLPGSETPLMAAARSGSIDGLRALLAHGADVNAAEPTAGQTALMWAVAEGHPDAAKVLIESGANVAAKSKKGFTPLLFASRIGDMTSVKLLLQAGVPVNDGEPTGGSALHAAVINSHHDLVDYLLEQGADPNRDGLVREPSFGQGGTWGTPLHAAILVANWQRTNVYFTPPRTFDKMRVMKALLAHGADPNARMAREPPKWRSGYYDNPMPNATPLALAASDGDVALMRLLLESGADPHARTKGNTTTLMLAAGLTYIQAQSRDAPGDHLEAVKMLVELGEDVNAVNDQGQTPLHATGYSGWNGVVEFLVSKGAKLNPKDKKGRTPLSIADGVYVGSSIYGQPRTAELLRKLGAEEPHQ